MERRNGRVISERGGPMIELTFDVEFELVQKCFQWKCLGIFGKFKISQGQKQEAGICLDRRNWKTSLTSRRDLERKKHHWDKSTQNDDKNLARNIDKW